MNPINIEKEEVAKLQFPREEILDSKSEINQRMLDAYRGMLLGNTYKNKVKIIFADKEGIKQIETTIWGVTEHRVLLKRGLQIPLHRIHKIIA
jgi:uncharacterized protein (UPF0248 family)